MPSRGQRLVEAMRLRGFHKQHALAHLLGVQESTITRWKHDKAITVDHAIAVCEALSISLDWFLCGVGPVDRPLPYNSDQRDAALPRSSLEEASSPFWFDVPVPPAMTYAYRL